MDLIIDIENSDTKSTYSSIKSLLNKFNSIEINKQNLKSLTVRLDFDEPSDISQAILWRYSFYLKKQLSCPKQFRIVNKNNLRHLRQNAFFNRLVGPKNDLLSFDNLNPLHFETFKPYTEEGSPSEDYLESLFASTLDKYLNKEDPFHREVRVQIKEILNNAFDHSQSVSDAGLICKVDDAKISFSLCDMGQGFKSSFISNPALKEKYAGFQDQEIIEKATGFKISCNPSEMPNPNYNHRNAGSGLFFLRKFVELHRENKLVIISNKGYFYLDGQGRLKLRNFVNAAWPGAVVFLEFGKDQVKNEEYIDLCKRSYDDEVDTSYVTVV